LSLMGNRNTYSGQSKKADEYRFQASLEHIKECKNRSEIAKRTGAGGSPTLYK
jgi:hypothetical protein